MVKFHLKSFFILITVLACLIAINVSPPETISIDPWLCRSYSGAEAIKNYGWPCHFMTTFRQPGIANRTMLIAYGSLAVDIVTLFISVGLVFSFLIRHQKKIS